MALRDDKIAVIGCGTMGEAMVKGLLKNGLIDVGRLVVSHPREERRLELETRHGVCAFGENAAAVDGASIVVLAVKPQYCDEVLAGIAGDLATDSLVITIVAGLRMEVVSNVLGVGRIVRAMPNTPAQIGQGITVWTTTDAVDDVGKTKVRTFLSALGEEELVDHESELDMATALSGTGPAYAFLFMEAMIDAGVHLGFSRRLASRLVFETMRGSVAFAAQSPDHLAKLRNQVTSPGGTTAEACYHLEKGRMRTVLSDGVWAAYRRCEQLGRREPSEEARISPK